MSDFSPETEAGYALALVPLSKEIADYVRSKLPDGTHFGVLVLVPPSEGQREGRTIAITSDRRTVARAAAYWILDILNPKRPPQPPEI